VEPSRTDFEILASSWNLVWCEMLRHRQTCQCSSSGPWWPRATLSALPTNARSLTFFLTWECRYSISVLRFCCWVYLPYQRPWLSSAAIRRVVFVQHWRAVFLVPVYVDPLSQSNVLSPLPFQKPDAHVM